MLQVRTNEGLLQTQVVRMAWRWRILEIFVGRVIGPYWTHHILP